MPKKTIVQNAVTAHLKSLVKPLVMFSPSKDGKLFIIKDTFVLGAILFGSIR